MEIVTYKPGESNPTLDRILSRSLDVNAEHITQVSAIIEGVRSAGDEALVAYTREFDSIELRPQDIRVDPSFIRSSAAKADKRVVEAFRVAIKNVRAFHERQRESSWHAESGDGSVVGQRILPIRSAGLYVPGGRAAYPSTVVMNAIPAQVAGVPRIAIATPPGSLEHNPTVAAVISELGIEEVYRIGGAQAIAALAFGTASVPRVDKIVGPGNAYVAVAKKLVFGAVGIDSIAGPTEVVVIADHTADPRFVAADLLAQAEHDESASAVCITTDPTLAPKVASEVASQLATLERRAIASESVARYGAVFVVDSIDDACELTNLIAPEHLELMTADDDRAAGRIDNAGAIFFGPYASEPVGDYIAGPNHVLPTLGTARFSSALGVYDFIKRQSVIRYNLEALKANADAIATMADAEGLTAHKRAALMRTQRNQDEE